MELISLGFEIMERIYYYEEDNSIFSVVYKNSKIDTVIIIDYNICKIPESNERVSYREYTNKQNILMKNYSFAYRILAETLTENFCFIRDLLNRKIEIPSAPQKNIQRNNGDNSYLEHHFESVFLEAYGLDSYIYLRKEDKIVGFYEENICIDYTIEKKDSKIAIEENGESYHHPQIIGIEKHKKQIVRQNAIMYQGYKVFRFSANEINMKEKMIDEMLDFFGEKESFIAIKPILQNRNFDLYEHQEDALEYLEQIRKNDINSSVIVLPTGTGKSHIGQEDIKRFLREKKDGKVAIVVPTRNLKQQWIDNFKKFDAEICVGENLENQIFVDTYSGLSNKKNRLSQDYFQYILVDEAHHSTAPELIKTIKHFNPEFLLGLTATPDRADKKELEIVFGQVERNLSLKEAIEQGILSPIKVYRLESNIDLSEVRFNGKNYINSDLEKKIVVESRNELIADAVNKYFGEETQLKKQGVIFCVSVEHSKKIAKLLKERGISAESVSGKDKKSLEYLEDYKKGKIQFLCSCSLINEGWDAPQTSVLVMARPTMSKVLYYQQLGRGTRKAEGKEALYVVDVVDNYGFTTVPWSTNSIFNNPHYIPFGNVLTGDRDFSGELIFIEHLLEQEEKLQEINIFTFEKKYEGYLTVEQLARELFVSTSTINMWVKKGEIYPEVKEKIGATPYYLFSPEQKEEIRKIKGLKERNNDTILDDFWEFIEEKDYSLSYKIIFILSFLKVLASDGEANFKKVKEIYASYYRKRILDNLPVDRNGCKYTLETLDNEKEIFRSILVNPFEKFERKRFILHSTDKENLGFSYFLWEKTGENSEDKKNFKEVLKTTMLKDLKEYYAQIGGVGDISMF